MSASSMKILCRYQYDPLDRLMGVGLLAGDSRERFYQKGHLTTELAQQTQRTIFRHQTQPLVQIQNEAGMTETTLLATDQAHSLLKTVSKNNPQKFSYNAYGHHPAASGLSALIGFNGECLDATTGHYPLGQGNRFFNPVLMRFNSPDELGPFDKEAGINTYAYCKGDPINFYDPTGSTPFSLYRLWNEPIIPSAISKYSIFRTRRTASSIGGAQPARNQMPSSLPNRRTSNAQPSAPTTSSSTSRLADQPGPSTTAQEFPFPHPLRKTQTHIPRTTTPARNTQHYRELLDDASRYDVYTANNPNYNPTVTSELLGKWNQYFTEASKSERTTPKLAIRKAKNGLRGTELEIKRYNIRKIQGNTPA
ncbi:RHS repeat-associated core domain-containing protein [Pseudomonas umsongensis]|jgi:RHS repeat-associated protein|uniref:RHS repeat-associated core domain-containing protein n=1 Tax=Pseudomonas umsongensis TaxID=198618 RepID=UPI0015BBB6E7|nr:RHS repeat-associated core domain-containing protein [Pseudomonas umsongensis]NWL18567.1 RHS repeat-associated core domain-containing protein [Pseudomonas umsongensis]